MKNPDKPLPWVILAWPFLWLYGTVRELRKPKVQFPQIEVAEATGTYTWTAGNGVSDPIPWDSTAKESMAALRQADQRNTLGPPIGVHYHGREHG